MNDSQTILKTTEDSDIEKGFSSFDTQKFLRILRKSIPVILLILATGITISILIVRYTKPEYQSSSILKLDIKSEASVLGLSSMEEAQNFNTISSEIELLRSRLFFNKVLDAIDLNVSVYAIGNILNDERYSNSPFNIEYKILNHSFYNKQFFIDVLANRRYKLTYSVGNNNIEGEYDFGETISNENFTLKIATSNDFMDDIQGEDFFFIIHSRNAQVEYLSKNLTVEPLNLQANTIQVSFKDYNRNKARDLVNAIDTIYLNYTQAEKNKANNQKIYFLNERLLDTENRLNEFEDYFESFTIQNKTTNLQDNITTTIRYLNEIDSQQVDIRVQLARLREIESTIDSEDSIEMTFTDLRLLPGDLRNEINMMNQLLMEREVLQNSYHQGTQAFQKKDREVNLLLKRIGTGIGQYIDDLERKDRDLSVKQHQLEDELFLLLH